MIQYAMITALREAYPATFTILEEHNKLMPKDKLLDSLDMLLRMACEKGRQQELLRANPPVCACSEDALAARRCCNGDGKCFACGLPHEC